MADLSPPWIRADFSGITDGPSINTLQRLQILLAGFVEEALLHHVDPYDIKLALQDALETIERGKVNRKHHSPKINKTANCTELIKADRRPKHVVPITPIPFISAVAK